MLSRLTLKLTLALVLAAPIAARAQDLPLTSGERLVKEALDTTRRNWWDRETRRTIDWKSLEEKYRDEARTADPLEAHHLVNRILGELKTSHLALVEGTVYDREIVSEFGASPTPRGGFELVRIEGSFFAAGVLEDSPAAKAGLLVGDEILSVNGLPPLESPLLEDAGHDPGLPGPEGYLLRITKENAKDVLELEVKHAAQGQKETLRFVPKAISMLEAARNSVRIVEAKGKKLGVVHLWHFMNIGMSKVLDDAIAGPLAEADGLVLDVRGRGGSTIVVSAVLRTFTTGKWKKPVVVLQDRGTRSAKELFGWSWRKKKLGPIVGERTAGACIGCQFKRLFDGSVLCYPAQDVRVMTNGEQLEGNGVIPDVAVDPGDLRWRAGKDRIFEEGVSVLLGRIDSAKRTRVF